MTSFRFPTAAALCLLAACSPQTPAQEPVPPAPAPTSTLEATAPASGTAPAAGEPASDGANAPSSGKMCGGIAGMQCPAKQYCVYAPEAHCGAADMSGTCAPIPDVCTLQLDEVCGCDDKTYGNACLAARASVSVLTRGACAPQPAAVLIPDGKLCGTRGVPGECDPASYCSFKSQCGATDAGGVCTKKPQICTKIYKPVCGCDGKTYASSCTAASAGVSVAREGACAKEG